MNVAIAPRGAAPASAFLLGIPFGLAGSPCTMPILINVLSLAAAAVNAVFGMSRSPFSLHKRMQ